MPPLTLDDNQAAYQIRAYRPGFIQINETVYTSSIVISSNQIITDWRPQALGELTQTDLQIIIPLKPTILLLGTGETLLFPALELYGDLINLGIGVEIMDTSAACRTYNVLTAEDRNVVAALIIR
jgi:uncharacterized protein